MKSFSQSGRRGFTLVEIMVAISVIGLLTTFGTNQYMRSSARVQTTACQENLEILNKAVELYNFDRSSYPAASDWQAALKPFFQNRNEPVCPHSGAYIPLAGDTGGIVEFFCSIHGKFEGSGAQYGNVGGVSMTPPVPEVPGF